MKLFFLALPLTLALCLTSACTKKSALTASSTTDSSQAPSTAQKADSPADGAGGAGSHSQPPTVQCPGGKAPKVYEGTCSGTWSLSRQTDGSNACVFNWGPAKECPKGATAIGYKAVCYGSLQKPGAASVEACSSQHGNPPSVTPYKLVCCE